MLKSVTRESDFALKSVIKLTFLGNSLVSFKKKCYLYQMGGKHLFLDEVHKYPSWSKELKEINDLYPSLKVTFFVINGKITFEVGGEGKRFDQIADIPDSYVLADSLEYPVGKKLPIWLVGFTY